MSERRKLLDEDQEEGILADYDDGMTLLKIEQKWNVARATIYHVLEKHGKTPNRTRKKQLMALDGQQAALLYQLIEAQEQRIATTEALIAEAVDDLLAVQLEGADIAICFTKPWWLRAQRVATEWSEEHGM